MRILVTGGAGYIGSITVQELLKKGHEVVVLDNLVHGHEQAVGVELLRGDLLDREFLEKSIPSSIEAVMHFAAYALAGDSMQRPYLYFQNNIQGGLNLLDVIVQKQIPYFIFSSTCAVYGTPDSLPVTERSSQHPESVYGESKLQFEKILSWYSELYDIKHVNLRYFNACGASLDGSLGEAHDPETHIIPLAIKSAIDGNPFKIFGTDYPTPDGTCIRDYIHVLDLAAGHIQALEYLKNNESDSFNLGTGNGYSNLEILSTIEKISGKKIDIQNIARRPGDPPKIFADNSKAREKLGFNPEYSGLDTIIQTAWTWHENPRF